MTRLFALCLLCGIGLATITIFALRVQDDLGAIAFVIGYFLIVAAGVWFLGYGFFKIGRWMLR